MSHVRIDLSENKLAYAPGEAIEGVVSWEFDEPPQGLELRLFWYTHGKGTQDEGVVAVEQYLAAAAVDARIFSLTAPDGPFTFSGRLVSLVWALELATHKQKYATHRRRIVIAPARVEVDLRGSRGS